MEANFEDIGNEIANHFDEINSPSSINLVGSGNHYQLVLLDNNYLFKIAKNRKFSGKIQRERNYLLSYQGQLGGLAVPYPKYYIQSQSIPNGAIGYRYITGEQSDVSQLYGSIRERYKDDLVHFISQMHSDTRNISDLGLEVYPPPQRTIKYQFEKVNQYLEQRLSENTIQNLYELQQGIMKYFRNHVFEPTIIHGDLKCENQIVEPSTQQLIGIVDFTNVKLGDPLVDIAFQSDIDATFRDEIYQLYRDKNPNVASVDIGKYSKFILKYRKFEKVFLELDMGIKNPKTIREITSLRHSQKNDEV